MEHINFFTRISLVRLMQRHGFKPLDTWETTRLIHAMPDPGIDGLFVPGDVAQGPEPDRAGPDAVRRYSRASAVLEERLRARIDRLARENPSVIVWGVGSLTMHLLAAEAFVDLPVRYFVDSNRNHQGKSIGNIPVVGPEEAGSRDGTILVVSHASEADIIVSIRTKFKLENPVVGLVSGFGIEAGVESAGY